MESVELVNVQICVDVNAIDSFREVSCVAINDFCFSHGWTFASEVETVKRPEE